ncbi:hypothetical protein ACEK06_03945 [Pseudomonas brenneri]|uniref:hypothetical protein n=1 Tax=Pseudomonas brenneri TaxID=129817 RepID=UPI003570D7F0
MAAFLIPFVAIAIGGAVATGAGIGVIESNKNKAAAAADKLKDIQETTLKLFDETNESAASGALYPAFRAARKYIDHLKSNYDLSPKMKEDLENSFGELKNSALSQFRKLAEDYKKEAAEAQYDDSGGELYAAQVKYLGSLEKLLGAGAPHLNVVEKSFGVNYQVHKSGIASN